VPFLGALAASNPGDLVGFLPGCEWIALMERNGWTALSAPDAPGTSSLLVRDGPFRFVRNGRNRKGKESSRWRTRKGMAVQRPDRGLGLPSSSEEVKSAFSTMRAMRDSATRVARSRPLWHRGRQHYSSGGTCRNGRCFGCLCRQKMGLHWEQACGPQWGWLFMVHQCRVLLAPDPCGDPPWLYSSFIPSSLETDAPLLSQRRYNMTLTRGHVRARLEDISLVY